MREFATRTYGKWILAGEHAVLRGSPALAFPLLNRGLDLRYEPSGAGLDLEFSGEHGEELKLLFYGVIENALRRLKVQEPLHGRFVIDSSLPVGAGLGASAALCGAVARWCQAQGWVPDDQPVRIRLPAGRFVSRREFRGGPGGFALVSRASDLSAAVLEQSLSVRWWPRLCLSYSGQRGMTADCVAKVKRFVFHATAARCRY